MRPIARIDRMLKGGFIDYLHDNNILTDGEYGNICNRYDEITKYWNEHPDQRFFQMLTNRGCIEEEGMRWFKEDLDFLVEAGVYIGDLIKWTSNYDRDMNPLPKPITRLVSELDTDHIENILDFVALQNAELPEKYKYAFETELAMRDGEYTEISNSEQKGTKCNSDNIRRYSI